MVHEALIRQMILVFGLETIVIFLKKTHHYNLFSGSYLLSLLHCLQFSSHASFY